MSKHDCWYCHGECDCICGDDDCIGCSYCADHEDEDDFPPDAEWGAVNFEDSDDA